VAPLVAVETSEGITGGTEIAESLIVDVKETSESILGVVKIIWSSAGTSSRSGKEIRSSSIEQVVRGR
jgi:hypothetical protein